MRSIIGIDPGVGGAIAVITEDGVVRGIHDMPVVGVGTKTTRRELNPAGLADVLMSVIRHTEDGAIPVYLELATGDISRGGPMCHICKRPRRHAGTASAFNYGSTYGGIKAVVATLRLPLTIVPPGKWKRSLSVAGKDKEGSRLRALELFPSQAALLARKKDHGRAEALLIAYYGLQQIGIE